MALVVLPASPGPRAVAWEPVDFGGTLRGPLGGSAQRVNRLGNRWKVQVTMPVMRPALAREWAGALTSGLRNGVSWKIRQVTTPTGSPGTVLVNGASQSGLSLICDGFNPGYAVRGGQWLNVTTGGNRYLYQSVSTVIGDGSGDATLAIEPALRAEPADNDPVELAVPYIDGLLVTPPGWSIDADRIARGFSFGIEEIR